VNGKESQLQFAISCSTIAMGFYNKNFSKPLNKNEGFTIKTVRTLPYYILVSYS